METTSVTPPGLGGAQAAQKAPGDLGKDQFLKLLVTQLANQDPLSPMDGTAFVAQLAQFSGLEQLVNMSDRLQALALTQTAGIGAQAVSFVGKTMTSRGGAFTFAGGQEGVPLQAELAHDAATTTLMVVNEKGETVATRELGAMKAGRRTFDFDGRDKDGNALPAGKYTFRVEAKDGTGAVVEATALSRGVVEAIVYSGGVPRLRVGGREVSLGDVMEVAS